MDIEVHTKRVELAEDLRMSAARKTERLGRYLAGMERAEVFFSNGQPGRLIEPVTCELVLEGHGHVVRASAAGPRPETALDLAMSKAELRLTRLKTRLVDRSRPKHADRRPAADEEEEIEGVTES
ncbi:MAG: HPF/RaiA family ribosome-associated protein [Acidimicrobiales bacterium]